jgi:NADPH-dependent 2,4-dienoyl-CoA reductase/sulfur reductase-like enzyme
VPLASFRSQVFDISLLPSRLQSLNVLISFQLPSVELALVSPRYTAIKQRMSSGKTKHVAIIGAGISGVVSAAHLLRRNVQVTVFERNSAVGGVW